jgi:hypothetical protein
VWSGNRMTNSIRPISGTSFFKIDDCNYRSINQLCGQSQKLVTFIKVSLVQTRRVKETC